MYHSRAQIVATIGPSTVELGMIRDLITKGVDVVRIDFSEGVFEDHRRAVSNVRIASAEQRRFIPLIGDLAGPSGMSNNTPYEADAILSPLTEHDRECITFCIEQQLDYVSLPQVGRAADVEDVRSILNGEGSYTKIISRIEKKEALRNFAQITDHSDGIMIMRKNLEGEIPLEQIPYVQHDLIRMLKWVHKPVITATATLSSMVSNPTPTRVEASDVAYAIISGSDAVMLKEETARGAYPLEAVATLEKIIVEAERRMPEIDTHLL